MVIAENQKITTLVAIETVLKRHTYLLLRNAPFL